MPITAATVTRSLHFDGEIYELYLRPEFQGLGFGRRLFSAAFARPRPERAEEHGHLGALGQRAGGGILPQPRRAHGGPVVRAIGGLRTSTRSRSPGRTNIQFLLSL